MDITYYRDLFSLTVDELLCGENVFENDFWARYRPTPGGGDDNETTNEGSEECDACPMSGRGPGANPQACGNLLREKTP
jgi:hypothetical protein